MNIEQIDAWDFFKPQIRQQAIEDEQRGKEKEKVSSKNILILIFQIIFFSSIYGIYKIQNRIKGMDEAEEE